MTTAEDDRLAEARAGAADWRRWGTYLSERAWGTVREDYSADGDAWNYFPFEHARSRAYRWNEDGLAGWCDRDQTICLGLAPVERQRRRSSRSARTASPTSRATTARTSRTTGSTPTTCPPTPTPSMVYKYPQAAFPYDDLLRRQRGPRPGRRRVRAVRRPATTTGSRTATSTSQVEYAKADPEDVVCRITVTNRGPDPAPIHVLPQLWYRNTWSWEPGSGAPRITQGRATAWPARRTRRSATAGCTSRRPTGRAPTWLFCENETNNEAPVRLAERLGHRQGRHRRRTSCTGEPTRSSTAEGSKAAAHRRGDRAARASRIDRDGALRAGRPRAAVRRRRRGPRGAQGRGRRVLRRLAAADARPTTSGSCSGRRSPGCCGASSTTTTRCAAGSRAIPTEPPPPDERWHGPQQRLAAPRQSTTSSSCPMPGSTPGTPPGTSRSTASPWP